MPLPPDPNLPPEPPPDVSRLWNWFVRPNPYPQPARYRDALGSGGIDPTSWLAVNEPLSIGNALKGVAPAIREQAEAKKTAPTPSELLPETGSMSASSGSSLRPLSGSAAVLEDLKALDPYFARPGGIQRVDKTRTNLGFNLAAAAAEEGREATKEEAYWQTAEQQDLGAVAAKKEKRINEDATAAEARHASVMEAHKKVTDKMEGDREYIRTHTKIDPYRVFTTNAAAGAFALLGSALMAGGAGLRKDNTLDWTKQLDTILAREAESQIRMLENKKWSLTDAGQNAKRILDTSRDEEEAKTRLQAQFLAGLGERANAISANAKGEIMKAQGKKAMAAINEKLGEHALNIAIREQGFESAENQAVLGANTQTKVANVGLVGTALTTNAQTESNRNRIAYELSKPVTDRVREIEKGWEDAKTALNFLQRTLHDPEASAATKNQAVAAYSTAFQAFMGGTAGTVGARNASSTFGVPASVEDVVKKLNRQPTVADLMAEGRRLDIGAHEKINHVRSGQWTGVPIPGDSKYTAPRK